MIQKMGHFGYDLANKDYKTIIQNVWDKLNEIIEVVNSFESAKIAPQTPDDKIFDDCIHKAQEIMETAPLLVRELLDIKNYKPERCINDEVREREET